MSPPPQPRRGTLVVYRNHFFQGGNDQVTLHLDGRVVGDIGHDQYGELNVPAGEHMLEASIGGLHLFAA
ncbi:MAG: hypothetical protein ACT4TC_21990 [Myxococcaceae bacterium]